MSDFGDLGVVGKLALPPLLKLWTCTDSILGVARYSPTNRCRQSVFLAEGPFFDRDSGLTGETLGDSRVACYS